MGICLDGASFILINSSSSYTEAVLVFPRHWFQPIGLWQFKLSIQKWRVWTCSSPNLSVGQWKQQKIGIFTIFWHLQTFCCQFRYQKNCHYFFWYYLHYYQSTMSLLKWSVKSILLHKSSLVYRQKSCLLSEKFQLKLNLNIGMNNNSRVTNSLPQNDTICM